MSDNLTSISLPRVNNSGLSIWGEVSIGSAINQLREQAPRGQSRDVRQEASRLAGKVAMRRVERIRYQSTPKQTGAKMK